MTAAKVTKVENATTEPLKQATPSGGTLWVEAPEWASAPADRLWGQLVARAVLAVLLVAVSLLLLSMVRGPLPGEGNGEARAGLVSQAAQASQAADDALVGATSDLSRSRGDVDAATASLQRAQALPDIAGTARRKRTAALAAARLELRTAKADLAQQVALVDAAARRQARALQLVAKSLGPARTTDADLLRAVALGLAGLLSLFGAIALLVPRSQSRLGYAIGTTLPGADHGAGDPAKPGAGRRGGGSTEGLPTGGTGWSATGPAVSAAGQPTSTGAAGALTADSRPFTKVEPVWAGAITLAGIIGAGVLGINIAPNGVEEQVINFVLPLVPLVGAYFVRRLVVPLHSLTR